MGSQGESVRTLETGRKVRLRCFYGSDIAEIGGDFANHLTMRRTLIGDRNGALNYFLLKRRNGVFLWVGFVACRGND